MANASILAAFERFGQHILTALGVKADAQHSHSITDIDGLTDHIKNTVLEEFHVVTDSDTF